MIKGLTGTGLLSTVVALTAARAGHCVSRCRTPG